MDFCGYDVCSLCEQEGDICLVICTQGLLWWGGLDLIPPPTAHGDLTPNQYFKPIPQNFLTIKKVVKPSFQSACAMGKQGPPSVHAYLLSFLEN